jgi:hypothetical protein
MARRVSPVPGWIPADLPGAPGVYRFVDANGTPLYIGKSVNLKRRVRGYFYGGGPTDPDKRDMLRIARGLEYHRTGSDLEALLDEAEGIGAVRPAFNRVHKNRARAWYVEVDWSRPFPRFRVLGEPRRAGARYIGPFRGRRIPVEACKLLEKIYRLRSCPGSVRPDPRGSPCLQHGIDQCSAPCVGLVGLEQYRRQVEQAVAALVDGAVAERHAREVHRRLDAASPGSDAAIGLERRSRWFEELTSYRPALRPLPVAASHLIVLPGTSPGERVLVPVARGRVLERERVTPGADVEERLRDACYRIRVAELRAEAAFPVAALTLTLIVARWVRERPEDGRVFDLDRLTVEDVVAAETASEARGVTS